MERFISAVSSNPYIFSAICALALCAVLPLIGFVIRIFTDYILSGLLLLITRSGSPAYILYNYLTIPGVIWHELSHALGAVITLAKVENIVLFHYDESEQTLGHVDYRTRGGLILTCLQLSVASCAPVITGLWAVYAYFFIMPRYDLPLYAVILLTYLLVSIVFHMDMSPQDLGSYIKGIWLFFIIFFVIFRYSDVSDILPEIFQFVRTS